MMWNGGPWVMSLESVVWLSDDILMKKRSSSGTAVESGLTSGSTVTSLLFPRHLCMCTRSARSCIAYELVDLVIVVMCPHVSPFQVEWLFSFNSSSLFTAGYSSLCMLSFSSRIPWFGVGRQAFWRYYSLWVVLVKHLGEDSVSLWSTMALPPMIDHLPPALLEACVVLGASYEKLKDLYQVPMQETHSILCHLAGYFIQCLFVGPTCH